MGKPKTLLEDICKHVLSFGADSISVERKDDLESVFAHTDGVRKRIAKFPSAGSDAKELLLNLHAAAKKGVRTVVAGNVFILTVRIHGSPGEEVFEVAIDPAPEPDPAAVPSFTSRQGEYLAFIYRYMKRYGQSPAETDLERHFLVSAPTVNAMVRTLERNGLIRRTPGKGRSIELLVRPEHLPLK
jgi:hypothetical protein